MRFDVQIGGRVHVVAIEPAPVDGRVGGRFLVTVTPAGDPAETERPADQDGVYACEIDVHATDLGLSWIVTPEGRSVDAAVTERTTGEWLVQLPGADVTARIDGRRLTDAVRADAIEGEARLLAPMPGRVLRILIAVGDEVQRGHALMVIEAMKMENELTASKAGRIREVAVAAGASVEAGRLLIVIE